MERMSERYTEAQGFLIDTRKLPMELRWKICGMVDAVNIFNDCFKGDIQSQDTAQQDRPGA